jgi:ribonucleoside-diphosphate reductase alpha chain
VDEREAQVNNTEPAQPSDNVDLDTMRSTVDYAKAEEKSESKQEVRAGSSTELLELQLGKAADAPLCMTCGTKMRPSGSCYLCEGCGSTSGCS